jgi:hypothetical protein
VSIIVIHVTYTRTPQGTATPMSDTLLSFDHIILCHTIVLSFNDILLLTYCLFNFFPYYVPVFYSSPTIPTRSYALASSAVCPCTNSTTTRWVLISFYYYLTVFWSYSTTVLLSFDLLCPCTNSTTTRYQ